MDSHHARSYPASDFEQFVREHRPLIAKICWLYARTSAEFDDLYQEILINLWRGLGRFEGRSRTTSWVYRICLNTCISCYRRERRHRDTLSLDCCTSLPADNDDHAEQLQQLRLLIDRLDPIEKAIILLWLDEVPYDEIAGITGLGRNTVATKIRRIRLKLCEQAAH
ncbi:MAG: sigma-70 family RNA polymerase sigma factor [Alistipes senegalensis]|nr:sigma-70 family RNA polymerase sigma factor [Bacteroides cellulosilyticus]MCM1351671.1 sigma-70 family RNA polymerase sigma factor [Alistipes senegalensis]